MLFRSQKAKSIFIDKLAFGSYKDQFKKDSTTNFAQLTRDEDEIKKYEDSPYCGFTCTNAFFNDFFTGLTRIHKKKNMEKIPKTLPIFLIAGSEDPVGEYGKSVMDLFEAYKDLGIEKLSMKLYPGGRHEILNEVNKEEVQDDIVNWYETLIQNSYRHKWKNYVFLASVISIFFRQKR